MSGGLLLDSHILLWLELQLPISSETLIAISDAGSSGRLFISDISVWEIGVALHKKNFERRPDLQGLSVEGWFRKTTANFHIRRMRISARIAVEAANVPGIYGTGDPGDCFLIATSRMQKLTLVTRDAKIISLANKKADYLDVMVA